MARSVLNLVLMLLLALVVLLTWTLRRDFTERNLEFLPGMVESVPFNAQSATGAFPDGKVLRRPVRGTIPTNLAPLHYASSPEDAARAGRELRNPFPDTLEAAIERGPKVFQTFCQPCHGVGGMGDGTIVQHGFPPPPSLLAEKALKLKDGQIFHIITYGQGNMPSLASQITREDRWMAIDHVRSLQKKGSLSSGGSK